MRRLAASGAALFVAACGAPDDATVGSAGIDVTGNTSANASEPGEQSATINVPADQRRWAVIDYRHYPPDPRSFTVRIDDKPMYFA